MQSIKSKKLKLTLIKIASFVIPIICLFVTKNKNRWAFYISPSSDLEGNLRAFLEHTLKNNRTIRPIIINGRTSNNKWIKKSYPDIPIISLDSLRLMDIINRAKCKALIVSHGLPRHSRDPFRFVKGVRIINLWHGTPLKGMNNLDQATQKNHNKIFKQGQKQDLFICSSETEKALLAGCLFLKGKNICVTGLPRNDWLTCQKKDLPAALNYESNKIAKMLEGKKLILYAPTWRASNKGAYAPTSDFLSLLSRIAEQHNALIGVRLHPKDTLSMDVASATDNKILNFNNNIVKEVNILLRHTDLLITDYSSLWVDFLLMERPIIGYTPDLEKYRLSRGLMFEYETIFPGTLCSDNEQLSIVLRRILTGESDKSANQKVKWLRSFFHKNTTGNASSLVYDEVRKIL